MIGKIKMGDIYWESMVLSPLMGHDNRVSVAASIQDIQGGSFCQRI